MTAVREYRLTQYAHGGGCACKIPPGELEAVVAGLLGGDPPAGPGELLVGLDDGDAAVVRIANGVAVVATADFFTPVVDDPYDWGRVAAANASRTQKAKYRVGRHRGHVRPIRLDDIEAHRPLAPRPASTPRPGARDGRDLVTHSGRPALHRYLTARRLSAWTQPVNTSSRPTQRSPPRDHAGSMCSPAAPQRARPHLLQRKRVAGPDTARNDHVRPRSGVLGGGRIDVVAHGGSNQSCTGPTTGRPSARPHGGTTMAGRSAPIPRSRHGVPAHWTSAPQTTTASSIYYANATWSNSEVWSTENALSSAPDAVSWGPGRLDVVMRNANHQLGHVYYDNKPDRQTFGTWQSSGPPTIASSGPQRLDIFFPTNGRASSTTTRLTAGRPRSIAGHFPRHSQRIRARPAHREGA